MIKKFECKECHHCFKADDQGQVECPNCHSDNVEYASFHLPKFNLPNKKIPKKALWGILAAIIAIIAGLFAWKYWPTAPVEEVVADSDSVTIEIPTTLVEPPSIEVGELTFDETGYSFTAKIINPPAVKYLVILMDAWDDKIIVSTSEDGQFTAVPFSQAEGGSYRIALKDPAADTLLCQPKVVPGFIRQVKVTQRMTAAQLQAKITARDPSLMGIGENDYLAPDVKLKFTGLPANAVNIPEVIAEIYDKIDNMAWKSATVTALEYDELNRISVITFKVVPDDGF